jgi:hypothetical protein
MDVLVLKSLHAAAALAKNAALVLANANVAK